MNQKAKVTYELKTEKGIVCDCSDLIRSNKAYASLLKAQERRRKLFGNSVLRG